MWHGCIRSGFLVTWNWSKINVVLMYRFGIYDDMERYGKSSHSFILSLTPFILHIAQIVHVSPMLCISMNCYNWYHDHTLDIHLIEPTNRSFTFHRKAQYTYRNCTIVFSAYIFIIVSNLGDLEEILRALWRNLECTRCTSHLSAQPEHTLHVIISFFFSNNF